MGAANAPLRGKLMDLNSVLIWGEKKEQTRTSLGKWNIMAEVTAEITFKKRSICI